jgi:hypothetical protein
MTQYTVHPERLAGKTRALRDAVIPREKPTVFVVPKAQKTGTVAHLSASFPRATIVVIHGTKAQRTRQCAAACTADFVVVEGRDMLLLQQHLTAQQP